MRALSASELLDVWEAGRDQSPVRRALALLAAACPETRSDDLAGLTIGRRDASLLALRERMFGPWVAGLASCGTCGEQLDVSFQLDEIRVPTSAAEQALDAAPTIEVQKGDYQLSCRLPTSADLEVAQRLDGADARTALLERCVLSAEERGEPRAAAELPTSVIAAIARALSEADPQADVELALACPGCGHAWSAAFDIVSFFWHEVNAWALRTVREVHLLASAYGWSEGEILALSPRRRQTYLELVQA
jgi:hypothetical protein